MRFKMFIYRVIDAGYCTIDKVESGEVSLDRIIEATAYLDLVKAAEWLAHEKSKDKK